MKPLLDLGAKDCRWPVSAEGEPFMFCAEPTAGGLSYCGCHAAASRVEKYRHPEWRSPKYRKGLVGGNGGWVMEAPPVDVFIRRQEHPTPLTVLSPAPFVSTSET